MKRLKQLSTIACIGLLSTLLAPSGNGDEFNRETKVTFSGPIEIPGVHLTGYNVLPAGTYVLKILDSQTNRHIVQIFSLDETTVYATILAVPNYRLQATDETVITFSERPSGQPEALRAWFYPGRNWGEEFVYPKEKAQALAKSANTAVLFTYLDFPSEVAEPIQSADAPVIESMRRAPILAIQPSGEEVQVAQVATPPPAIGTEVVEPTAELTTLPATGSSLPVIGVFGLFLLTAAVAVRTAAKRL